MSRWEYRTIQVDWRPKTTTTVGGHAVDRFDAVEAVMNDLGAEGWEAVGIEAGSSWRVLLKRPAPR